MKLVKNICFMIFSVAALLFAACKVSSYPEDTDATADANVKNEKHEDRAAVTLASVDAPLGADYIRGFDASAVDYYEQEKLINGSNAWYDTDGTKMDFFKILKKYGVNTVRLRVWVDPSQPNASEEVPDGDNSPARTVRLAKRVKEAGLKLMIDFHYSDFWADPGKQVTPAAWQTLGSAEAVAKALYDHTYDVLTNLNAVGAAADYVQVGNEINTGILIYTGTTKAGPDADTTATGSFAYSGSTGGSHFISYLESGCAAVRAAAPNAQIILHVASGGGATTVISNVSDVDYDIIGLSYYPWESAHGTTTNLAKFIAEWEKEYERPVVITECGYFWNYSDTSTKTITALNNAYEHLLDSDGTVFADLDVQETEDGKRYVAGTIENQAKVLRHIAEVSAAAGARGFCVWGGEIQGSFNWQYGMFDSNGEALPSFAVFGVQGTGEPEPISVKTPGEFAVTVDEANVLGNAIPLSWTESENAKSYSVYYKKATDAENKYKAATTGITATTYTVMGVKTGTTYDIKVVAKRMQSQRTVVVQATTEAEVTAPGDFSIAETTSSDGKLLSFSWTASKGADSYTVSYKASSASDYKVAATGLTATSYTLEDLTWGTTYDIIVTATNNVGSTTAKATGTTVKSYTQNWSGSTITLLKAGELPSTATDVIIVVSDCVGFVESGNSPTWITGYTLKDNNWGNKWEGLASDTEKENKLSAWTSGKDAELTAIRENDFYIGAGNVTSFTITVSYE